MPKKPLKSLVAPVGCSPSTARGVARQAASEKVSCYRGPLGCSSCTCGCYATLCNYGFGLPICWQSEGNELLKNVQVIALPLFMAILLNRGRKFNTNFFFCFLKLFGRFQDIPAKILGYPTQKFGFPGFLGTYRTFCSLPPHVEDPHPTGRYPDPRVWVCAPFLA